MSSATGARMATDAWASPGFSATVASEWTKLRSVRSTWIIAFLALALSIGISALVSIATGVRYDESSATEPATVDPLLNINFGLIFGAILLNVLGVTAVTSEYSSGMIRTTFIVTPQRLKVLAAKAVVVGATGMVLSATMVIGMYLLSQVIYGSFGMETANLGDRDVYQFLSVYAAGGGIVYTLIPFSLAFLLRGTASALTISIGMFFLPAMVGAAMPLWVQENVLQYLPDVALDNLAGAISSSAALHQSDLPAAVVIAFWLIGGLVIASIRLKRLDA